jgi:hypothetical protein
MDVHPPKNVSIGIGPYPHHEMMVSVNLPIFEDTAFLKSLLKGQSPWIHGGFFDKFGLG